MAMKKILTAVFVGLLLATLFTTPTASAQAMAPKGKTSPPENGEIVQENIYIPDKIPWEKIHEYALGKASKASLKTLKRCDKTIVYSERFEGRMFASLICVQPKEDLRLPKMQGH